MNKHVQAYVCINTYVRMSTHTTDTQIDTHTDTNTHAHIHTHVRTHIHTNTGEKLPLTYMG